MRIKSLIAFALTFVLFASSSMAQPRSSERYYYLLLLKDKGLNYVRIDEPETFLSERALERRKKFDIPIDSFDLPVTKAYIDNINKRGVNVLYPTKWLNGVVVSTAVPDSARVLLFSWYVDKAIYLGKSEERWFDKPGGKSEPSLDGEVPTKQSFRRGEFESESAPDRLTVQDDTETYGKAYDQIDMINGLPLHQMSKKGKGVQIAVFDEGFYKVNKLSIFKHLIDNKQIIGTYDLVNFDDDVFQDGDHGMKVLSCLAGSKKGKMTGTAPAADYYLFRTEDNRSEYLIEELNWIRAAEMADSMGVDIINSSLGYTTFDDKSMNHKWSDLDGETTYITRGADIAASKGILVVNSAGNDGNKSWKYLDPPADAKNILTVGAVDMRGKLAAFSSVNEPSYLETKPDVVAPGKGVFVANSYGSVSSGNGTSYACPITAGLCACLLELNPKASPEQVIRAVQKSSTRAYYPDNFYGYGIPSFELANTFLGGNPAFDYSKVQFVPDKTRFASNVFQVDVYSKDYEELDIWVTVKKRFLFFKYQKKLNHSSMFTDESFNRVQAFVPAKHTGKEIILKATASGQNGKETFYSHPFIIDQQAEE